MKPNLCEHIAYHNQDKEKNKTFVAGWYLKILTFSFLSLHCLFSLKYVFI